MSATSSSGTSIAAKWPPRSNGVQRTMLSVRVEDLVATDLIFTTLMGEDVENRRKFIEDNALDVKNLDV